MVANNLFAEAAGNYGAALGDFLETFLGNPDATLGDAWASFESPEEDDDDVLDEAALADIETGLSDLIAEHGEDFPITDVE